MLMILIDAFGLMCLKFPHASASLKLLNRLLNSERYKKESKYLI